VAALSLILAHKIAHSKRENYLSSPTSSSLSLGGQSRDLVSLMRGPSPSPSPSDK